jgi:predicted DNA-binding antitoxin AbrB/MazE fold protein
MKTIHAVFEKGVFRPTEPVDLPEGKEVQVIAADEAEPSGEATNSEGMDEIYEILSRRYKSGHHDTAERHNEHQP